MSTEVLLGLRAIERDGARVFQVKCPVCATWADVDDDQLHGRVSTYHDPADGGCGFHESFDWWAAYDALGLLDRVL